MRELLIATTNKNKYSEIVTGLQDIPFIILNLSDIAPLGDVEETANTIEGNAVKKAKEYGSRSGKLTLAEDTGLEVEALGGRPGVHTARYGEDDAGRNRKLLKELEGVPAEKRTARFITVIAIYDPEHGDTMRVCEGTATGHISEEYRGTNGFGFDPIFFYDDAGKYGGEMSAEEKQRVSHRGKAVEKAREILLAEFA